MTEMKRVKLLYDNNSLGQDPPAPTLEDLADALSKFTGGNHGVVVRTGGGWEEVYLTVSLDKVEPLLTILEGWTEIICQVDAVTITA